ncbi:Zn-dependent protease [Gammaproteobacteria bacterium]|nr:Zn-dependent protease [Gammaproteobacteria bacterium]
MSFFRRKDAILRKTNYLIILFLCAYMVVIAAFSGAMVIFISFFTKEPLSSYWDKALIACTCLALSIIFIETFMKMYQLRGGAEAVMHAMNAVEVDELNPRERVKSYVNIIQELAVAARMQIPRAYILPQENINALAVASNNKDASIAVTQGALLRLSREELQGMVAHEMSHILHKDCLLNFKLVAWLYGLQSLFLMGRSLLGLAGGTYPKQFDRLGLGVERDFYYDKSGRFESVPFARMFMFGLGWIYLTVGFTGALCARAIKSKISREREYLADTEAVRMTRNNALAKVLMKIAKLTSSMPVMLSKQGAQSFELFSHFYLSDYAARKGWFNTHPPILLRIKAIDRTFVPAYLQYIDAGIIEEAFGDESGSGVAMAMAPQNVLMRKAQTQLSTIQIMQDTSNINVIGFGCALLLSKDKTIFNQQIKIITDTLSSNIAAYTQKIYSQQITLLSNSKRLPLMLNIFPSLKNISALDLEKTKRCLFLLIKADGNVSVFEYTLWRLLNQAIDKINKPLFTLDFSKQEDTLAQHMIAVSKLFSILAEHSFINQENARIQYNKAWNNLNFPEDCIYEHGINLVKTLDSIFIDLATLSPISSMLLSRSIELLIDNSECTQTGKDLVHLVCLILTLPLPNSIKISDAR